MPTTTGPTVLGHGPNHIVSTPIARLAGRLIEIVRLVGVHPVAGVFARGIGGSQFGQQPLALDVDVGQHPPQPPGQVPRRPTEQRHRRGVFRIVGDAFCRLAQGGEEIAALKRAEGNVGERSGGWRRAAPASPLGLGDC